MTFALVLVLVLSALVNFLASASYAAMTVYLLRSGSGDALGIDWPYVALSALLCVVAMLSGVMLLLHLR